MAVKPSHRSMQIAILQ